MKLIISRLLLCLCIGIIGFAVGHVHPLQINADAGHIDSVRKVRYFYVVWEHGNETGTMGIRKGDGVYPSLEELKMWSNNRKGTVYTNIIELKEPDYNQLFKDTK